VYPRGRRSLLEGTFEWAALVGRGGHRGVGHAPCALKQDALSFGFLQVLSGISPFVYGDPRAVPDISGWPADAPAMSSLSRRGVAAGFG
jgi:hypothetical protein